VGSAEPAPPTPRPR